MRDFFIDWAEKLLTVLIAFMVLAVVIAGFGAMFAPQGGFFQGLGILIGGTLYVIVMGGVMYLVFGIYRNTQKTNELLADLLRK